MNQISRKLLLYWFKKTMEFTSKHREGTTKSRLFRSYRRRCINYVQSKCSSNFVVLEGRKMFLNEGDYLKLLVTEHEGLATRIAKNEIKKGDTVLDLGAHIGYWTCLFAKLVGKTGKVFAFEPDPESFQILKKNVEINGYKNVTLEQKAVGDKTQKTRLYKSYLATDNRIYDTHENRDSIEIDVVRLDDYFNGFEGEIDFIKSNIQGADFKAVQGMPSLIKKSKNLKMMLEYCPFMLNEFGSDQKEFIDTLVKKEFMINTVHWADKKMKPAQLDVIKEHELSNQFNICLFCETKKPKHSETNVVQKGKV